MPMISQSVTHIRVQPLSSGALHSFLTVSVVFVDWVWPSCCCGILSFYCLNLTFWCSGLLHSGLWQIGCRCGLLGGCCVREWGGYRPRGVACHQPATSDWGGGWLSHRLPVSTCCSRLPNYPTTVARHFVAYMIIIMLPYPASPAGDPAGCAHRCTRSRTFV